MMQLRGMCRFPKKQITEISVIFQNTYSQRKVFSKILKDIGIFGNFRNFGNWKLRVLEISEITEFFELAETSEVSLPKFPKFP
jgi:hypothetical protein